MKLFLLIQEKEIRQGIRTKRKQEDKKQKILTKQEIEITEKQPIKMDTINTTITTANVIANTIEKKKLLYKRLKTIKVDENPMIGFVLNKAKPTVDKTKSYYNFEFQINMKNNLD